MALFCPSCANLLVLEPSMNSFTCRACPYQFQVQEKLGVKITLKTRQVDDVLGGPEAWEGVEQMSANCPECSAQKAYFMQMQTRSADEPMTTFYKCVTCKYMWKED
eukprot:GEMP01109702.1.p1 GENE.GEMP01109702.1~~GEMP01109702.1.p1  ORF type:complete len:106 (+),score=20.63 GEMP01109702.1:53-370(+)